MVYTCILYVYICIYVYSKEMYIYIYNIYKQIDRYTCVYIYIYNIYIYIYLCMSIHNMNRQTDRQVGRKAGKPIDCPTNRHAGRLLSMQTNKQTVTSSTIVKETKL